ncbi:MAG: TonB-dependent receptor [Gemmatimonadales bacterium]
MIPSLLLALVAVPAQDTIRLPAITAVARHPDSVSRLPLAATRLLLTPNRGAVGRSLADMLGAVPGLFTADRGNPSRDDVIAVRGVGARASFGVRGVRVFLDGIPQTLPDGQTQLSAIDPSSLTRVDVLRGAASAWYGNAAGGALLFETAPPATTTGYADVRVGAYGARRVGLSGTLGDGLSGLRASVAHERGTGWRDHASWETWRASLTGGLPALGGRLTTHATFTRQPLLEDPGALTADEVAATPRMAAPAFVSANARKAVTHAQGGTSLTWARGRVGASVATWGQVRDLKNPLPFVDITLGRRAGGVRAGVDVTLSPAMSLGAGIEAQSLRDDRVNRNAAGTAIVRDQIESVAEVAPWLQGRWRPTGALSVQASARFDAVRFAVTDRRLDDGDGSGQRTLTAPSLALGVAVAAHPLLRPWAGVATVFETPTSNELSNRPDGQGGFNTELDPERGVQIELGVRGAHAAASWELVAWRTQVRDGLVPYESPLEPGRILFRNAGQIGRDGLEAGLTVRPLSVVTIEGQLTASDFRYDEFSTTAGTFDGNRVPGVPVRRATTRATLGGVRAWGSVDLRTTTGVPVDDANTAEAAGWTTLGARVGGAAPLGGAWLSGWIALENVLDTRYVGAVQVNANGGRFYEPGAGRALTLAFSVSGRQAGRSWSAR